MEDFELGHKSYRPKMENAQNGQKSFPFLGQNRAKDMENGSIHVHGSNKIGKMSSEPKKYCFFLSKTCQNIQK